jgi:hypothetical protein
LRVLLAFFLLASTAFPSNSQTAWMRPDAFKLRLGMERGQVVHALERWNPKQGKDANELVVDYSGERALTLEFKSDRLHSIRFELFAFIPEVRKAFDEEKQRLRETLGEPRKSTKSVLIYDRKLPNVMVVLADDLKSSQGKQGFGMLAVRYFDPIVRSLDSARDDTRGAGVTSTPPAQTAPSSPPAGQ